MENILSLDLNKEEPFIKEVLQFLLKDSTLIQNSFVEIKSYYTKKERQNKKFDKYQKSWILFLIYFFAEKHEKTLLKELKQKKLEHSSLWIEFKKLPLKYQIVFFIKTKHPTLKDSILSDALSLSLESIPLIYTQSIQSLHNKRETLYQQIDNIPQITISPFQFLEELEKYSFQSQQAPAHSQKKGRKTPWYIKTSLEGGFIGLVIIALIAFIPKILSFYEQSLDRKLESFENIQSTAESLEVEKIDPTLTPPPPPSSETVATDSLENIDKNLPAFSSKKFRIFPNQYVRFVISSSSVEEMRVHVNTILSALTVVENETPVNGLEIPGGIQFKVLLSAQDTESFKEKIEAILLQEATQNSHLSQDKSSPVSWYINPSRKRLPKGMVEVVIFITQN